MNDKRAIAYAVACTVQSFAPSAHAPFNVLQVFKRRIHDHTFPNLATAIGNTVSDVKRHVRKNGCLPRCD
jgi:hypothetical protein